MSRLNQLIQQHENRMFTKLLAFMQFGGITIGCYLVSIGLELNLTTTIGLWLLVWVLMPPVKP